MDSDASYDNSFDTYGTVELYAKRIRPGIRNLDYAAIFAALEPYLQLPFVLHEPLAHLLILFHICDGFYFWQHGTTSLLSYARTRLPERRFMVLAVAYYFLSGTAQFNRYMYAREAFYFTVMEATKVVIIGWVIRAPFQIRIVKRCEKKLLDKVRDRLEGRTLGAPASTAASVPKAVKVDSRSVELEKEKEKEKITPVATDIVSTESEQARMDEVRRLRNEKLRKLEEVAKFKRRQKVRHVPRSGYDVV